MNSRASIVWETLYPDRRPWVQLEADTREEWSRMVDVVEGVVNADAFRLREALKWASNEAKGRLPDWFHECLATPPPPVVAAVDADSLINQLEQVEETLKGGEIFPPDALKAISKVLQTHREKYPKP